MSKIPDDYEWLDYFHAEADFGPADWDVRNIMYQNYLAEGGTPVDYMEGED